MTGKNLGNEKVWRLTSLVCMILMVLAIALAVLPGCTKGSRGSGSTVTGRCLRFPIDSGVPFIRVLVNGENALRFQVTDSNGSFTMNHVPTGSYEVKFARFGLELYSTDLVIEENEITCIVNMPELADGIAELSGSVSDHLDFVGGCKVWIIYPDNGLAYAETDENGEYAFENLPDGETTIVAIADDHQVKIIEDIKVGFEGVYELDIEVDVIPDFDSGAVKGVVRNQDGEILEESYVGIFRNDVDPSIYMVAQEETLTTIDGYELAEIPPGTYTIICTHSGYVLESEPVNIEAFVEYTVDFVLDSDEDIWRSPERNNNRMMQEQ